jgi:hypothetical protein
MSENNNGATKVLYLVSCASRPAQWIQEFVPLAQAKGWDVCDRNSTGDKICRYSSA